MSDAQQPVRSTDLLAVWRWAVIENIVTIICTLLGCWLVSGWFGLLLLNLNYRKESANAPTSATEANHE